LGYTVRSIRHTMRFIQSRANYYSYYLSTSGSLVNHWWRQQCWHFNGCSFRPITAAPVQRRTSWFVDWNPRD